MPWGRGDAVMGCKSDVSYLDFFTPMTVFRSRRENFRLSWLPYLVILPKVELFMPWWLENRATLRVVPVSSRNCGRNSSGGRHALVPPVGSESWYLWEGLLLQWCSFPKYLI